MVYVALDDQDKVVVVGRTKQVERRTEEHGLRGWRLQTIIEIDDPQKARIVEQYVLNTVREGKSWRLEDLRQT